MNDDRSRHSPYRNSGKWLGFMTEEVVSVSCPLMPEELCVLGPEGSGRLSGRGSYVL